MLGGDSGEKKKKNHGTVLGQGEESVKGEGFRGLLELSLHPSLPFYLGRFCVVISTGN